MNNVDRFWAQLFSKAYCGLGSVIVPPDVDRQVYIDNCFSTETVSVMPQTGGMSYNKVPISLEALQHIEFPEEGNSFGSQVVYLFHPVTRFPFIIAVIDKKSELFGVQWKQFKQFKSHDGNFVSIVGDGKRGTLYVSVLGTEENKGGQILIDVSNPQEKGLVRISVQGDIQLVHSNLFMQNLTTKIASKELVEVKTKTISLLASEKISLGEEKYEPVVLGQTLIDEIIKPLLESLTQDLKVSTAVGPSGTPLPDFVVKIQQIKGKLNDILSKKVETE